MLPVKLWRWTPRTKVRETACRTLSGCRASWRKVPPKFVDYWRGTRKIHGPTRRLGCLRFSAGRCGPQKRTFYRLFESSLNIGRHEKGCCTRFVPGPRFIVAYLKYSFMMEKLGRTGRGMLVIGLLILLQFANLAFVGRLAPVGMVIVAFYCLFVLWIWVAKGVGNLFLLFDRFARLALRVDEKREALVVGGGVLFGLASFSAGLLLKQISLIFVGLTFIAAAFPMSLFFTNRSRPGRIVFGRSEPSSISEDFSHSCLWCSPSATQAISPQPFSVGP